MLRQDLGLKPFPDTEPQNGISAADSEGEDFQPEQNQGLILQPKPMKKVSGARTGTKVGLR